MVKTKALARSFCYWKGLDKDVEDNISKCRQCREKQNLPKKEINHPWEPASEPWERVHIDFAGPTNGNYFLLVVDAFSKWVEVIPTKSITSSWTIRELRKIFTTFGLPSVIVSDNGRQFTSSEFSNFLKKCGTLHKKTAPYHPSSNGQVERFVQTIKKLINCMSDESGTLEEKLHQLLMKIRQAPNSTGNSSYFLMFNRKIRTYLSLLLPKTKEETKQPKGIAHVVTLVGSSGILHLPGGRSGLKNPGPRDLLHETDIWAKLFTDME
ncbi:uncharacterized protein K02A2.6-like [Macrosteles quadrilineatus]|uniref:uncharacterized protein K02A2.6-like n=1 Tax=Macrosteles quadrilineatus TaxID=74068 RepID=UPI0023E1B7B9|nr:uncharacterized protein K02A2.6-like [Macrosteles quadrilineatus]